MKCLIFKRNNSHMRKTTRSLHWGISKNPVVHKITQQMSRVWWSYLVVLVSVQVAFDRLVFQVLTRITSTAVSICECVTANVVTRRRQSNSERPSQRFTSGSQNGPSAGWPTTDRTAPGRHRPAQPTNQSRKHVMARERRRSMTKQAVVRANDPSKQE